MSRSYISYSLAVYLWTCNLYFVVFLKIVLTSQLFNASVVSFCRVSFSKSCFLARNLDWKLRQKVWDHSSHIYSLVPSEARDLDVCYSVNSYQTPVHHMDCEHLTHPMGIQNPNHQTFLFTKFLAVPNIFWTHKWFTSFLLLWECQTSNEPVQNQTQWEIIIFNAANSAVQWL